MPTLLHIDSSPRGDRSISRKLSRVFAEEWQRKNLDGKVVYRDLVMTNLPFVDVQWIGGAYSPPEEHTPEQSAALRISDDLVAEFLSADEIVLGTPMYNFNVPANVKAWIDHIVRVGKTFEIKDTELKGLVPAGRKATVEVTSRRAVRGRITITRARICKPSSTLSVLPTPTSYWLAMPRTYPKARSRKSTS